MNFWQFLQQNWFELLTLIRQHIALVAISIAVAVVIGVPTGILVTRRQSLRGPVLGLANVMQTIPSLALFGFLIPLPFVGGIGARTALVALVLYALLPIIRNTVTGILGVEPSVRVATIAAAVGAGGLGVYIFRGLRQYDNNLLLAGALPAALLALAADFSLGLVEQQFTFDTKRSRITLVQKLILVVLALFVILAGYGFWRGARMQTEKRLDQGHVALGSKDFTESILLGEIVAQLLEARGVSVERQFELGGNLPHEALVSGRLDLYPEYTGTSYAAILHHPPISDPRAVYEQVKREYAERFKIGVSPPLGFENTFAILVRGADARQLKIKSISDAVPYARRWRAGFGQDFMSRADGYPGFSRAYGLQFAGQPREMDLSLTYIALASGQVDLIAGNSTEGRIAKLDLFQLEDDRHYFPPYEAVYLARQDSLAHVPALRDALAKLANSISTEEMRRLNYEVDGNKRDPKDVIREW